MTDAEQAARLRDRADHLRSLAARIDSTAVFHLGPLAAEDTWRGPGPLHCVDALHRAQGRLADAVAGLRRAERRLLAEAERIEAALLARAF